MRNFLILIFLLAITHLNCHSPQTPLHAKQSVKMKLEIAGLYSYDITSKFCETIRHSLRLNKDSSFIYKVYCYADSTSSLQPTIKVGKWHLVNPLLHFICSDSTKFDGEIIDTGIIWLTSKFKEEKDTYPFKKDTTTNEMFWTKSSK